MPVRSDDSVPRSTLDADLEVCAAEGVDAIFAMGTPFEAGIEAEIRQGSTVAEAAL
jgi:hypothetical protein